MAADIHHWQPLTPEEIHKLLTEFRIPWWIAGGWAIDLFVGRETRPHGDTDVLIRRRDQRAIQEYLADWDLHKTQQPGLKPWPRGEFLGPGVNDIWCRPTSDAPWSLQLMLLDTEEDGWVFRRDPAIRGNLASIGRRTASGIPYVGPEIQLLYTAKPEPLDKDQAEFENAVPLLDASACGWLLQCLQHRFPQGHEWIAALERRKTGERKNDEDPF